MKLTVFWHRICSPLRYDANPTPTLRSATGQAGKLSGRSPSGGGLVGLKELEF